MQGKKQKRSSYSDKYETTYIIPNYDKDSYFKKQYTAKGLEVIVTMRYKAFRHVENEKSKRKKTAPTPVANATAKAFFLFRYVVNVNIALLFTTKLCLYKY